MGGHSLLHIRSHHTYPDLMADSESFRPLLGYEAKGGKFRKPNAPRGNGVIAIVAARLPQFGIHYGNAQNF